MSKTAETVRECFEKPYSFLKICCLAQIRKILGRTSVSKLKALRLQLY